MQVKTQVSNFYTLQRFYTDYRKQVLADCNAVRQICLELTGSPRSAELVEAALQALTSIQERLDVITERIDEERDLLPQ